MYGKDPIYSGRLRHGEESYGMVRCDQVWIRFTEVRTGGVWSGKVRSVLLVYGMD